MNYFELYDLPMSLKIDAAGLKKAFYRLSRETHPDFHTLADAEAQAEALERASANNEAYKVLKNMDLRLRYLLDMKDLVGEEGQNKVPQDFLMEMMEVNELVMELELSPDAEALAQARAALEAHEAQIAAPVAHLLEAPSLEDADAGDWDLLKDFYFKRKYILRLRENLSKFASL